MQHVHYEVFQQYRRRCEMLQDKEAGFRRLWKAGTDARAALIVRTNEANPVRDKRQVLVGLAVGAAFGIAAAFSNLFSHQDLTDIAYNQKALIRQMSEQETRLKAHDDALASLQQFTEYIAFQVSMAYVGRRLLGELMLVQGVLDIFENELNRLMTGFDLLKRHRLHANLINVPMLELAFNDLLTMFAASGYTAAIDELSDIFLMDVSHLYHPNGTIIIMIHVPAYKTNTALNILEFLPFPLGLTVHSSGDKDDPQSAYMIPKLDRPIFAISTDDSYQMTLAPEDLLSCQKYSNVYFCDELNVFDRRMQEACLPALYARNLPGIKKECMWTTKTSRDFALQLSTHEFLLFQTDDHPIKLICDDAPTLQENVQGARQIYVPPRCHLLTRSFKFEGQLDLNLYRPATIVNHFNFTAALIEASGDDGGILAHVKEYNLAGTDKGATIDHIAEHYRQVTVGQTHRFWSLGVGIGLGLLISIIVAWKVRQCVQGRRLKRRREQEGQSYGLQQLLAEEAEHQARLVRSGYQPSDAPSRIRPVYALPPRLAGGPVFQPARQVLGEPTGLGCDGYLGQNLHVNPETGRVEMNGAKRKTPRKRKAPKLPKLPYRPVGSDGGNKGAEEVPVPEDQRIMNLSDSEANEPTDLADLPFMAVDRVIHGMAVQGFARAAGQDHSLEGVDGAEAKTGT